MGSAVKWLFQIAGATRRPPRAADMASKEVKMRQLECEACDEKVLLPADSRGLPPGWTEATIQLMSGVGEYTKGIDLCPECSKDLEAGKRKAKARWGQ
jgi:hypothetical protein